MQIKQKNKTWKVFLFERKIIKSVSLNYPLKLKNFFENIFRRNVITFRNLRYTREKWRVKKYEDENFCQNFPADIVGRNRLPAGRSLFADQQIKAEEERMDS